jgi:hypothetical protein
MNAADRVIRWSTALAVLGVAVVAAVVSARVVDDAAPGGPEALAGPRIVEIWRPRSADVEPVVA